LRRFGTVLLQRVNVLRQKPRGRDKLRWLAGSLSVSITAESYLHVGSTRTQLTINEEDVKRTLLKYRGVSKSAIEAIKFEEHTTFSLTSNGTPTIPGSSVKGNIRSRLELGFRAKNGIVRSCFIRASPVKEISQGAHGWRHSRIWGDVVFENRGFPCDLTKNEEVCLICDLFGTTGLKSLIDFSDFIGKDISLVPLDLEYDMRILAAPPNSKFLGEITFYNLKPEELGLLFVGMSLGKTTLLGRLKYRRSVSGYTFGRVRYVVEILKLWPDSEQLAVNDLTVKPGEAVEEIKLNAIINSLKSLAFEVFKDELAEVDEVEVVERLPGH
jgi:hypothetical protein